MSQNLSSAAVVIGALRVNNRMPETFLFEGGNYEYGSILTNICVYLFQFYMKFSE